VLEAHVSGPIKTAAFALVSNTDEQIKPLQMHTVHAGADEREFVSNLELPISPFRIIVSGTDLNGYSYQRFFNPLFHPTMLLWFLSEGLRMFCRHDSRFYLQRLKRRGCGNIPCCCGFRPKLCDVCRPERGHSVDC
jgi:hypothetical protein